METPIDRWRQEGKLIGRREGREEGKHEEAVAMTLRLLPRSSTKPIADWPGSLVTLPRASTLAIVNSIFTSGLGGPATFAYFTAGVGVGIGVETGAGVRVGAPVTASTRSFAR